MTISLKTILPETITSTFIFELVKKLSSADLQWLRDQIDNLLEKENPLPVQATLGEAIQLYMDDQCSLGRAAEIAGVTRWEIQDVLKDRGIPIMIYSSKTVEEIDQLEHELEREGLLC